MKINKNKALGLALIMQLMLYFVQSLVLKFIYDYSGGDEVLSLGISVITVCFVFIIPVKFYSSITGTPPSSYENFPKKKKTEYNPKTVILFIFSVSITVTAVNIFGMLSELVLSFFGFSAVQTAPGGAEFFVFTFLKSVLLAALLEELLFRGTVFDAYEKEKTSVKILISAFLFALMHYNLTQFLYAFAAGAVIAYFAVKTNSLLFAVLTHFSQNLMTFVFTFLSVKLDSYTYGLVSDIAFWVFFALAVVGIFCLVAEKLKSGVVRKDSDKSRCVGLPEDLEKSQDKNAESGAVKKNYGVKSVFCPEITVYIIFAAVISVFNF